MLLKCCLMVNKESLQHSWVTNGTYCDKVEINTAFDARPAVKLSSRIVNFFYSFFGGCWVERLDGLRYSNGN